MLSVLAPTYTVTARRMQAPEGRYEYVVALRDREAIRSTTPFKTWEAARDAGDVHARRLLGAKRLSAGVS